jgi:trypsin
MVHISNSFALLLASVVALPAMFTESIVGGLPTGSSDQYPMIVSMQRNNRHFCGGTLVDPFTVVTAAHCSRVPMPVNLTVVAHRSDFRKPLEEEGAIVFSVNEIRIHPNFNNTNFSYDLAIWKVNFESGDAQSLKLDTVRLDDGSKSQPGQLLTTAGWGTTEWLGSASPELLEVKVPVTTVEDCLVSYPDLDVPSGICAGFPEGLKDSCSGDSGGPLFDYQDNVFTLVGVVSYGDECAKPGFPGVYVRITSVVDYIKENMGAKIV